jgi:hypothetical protein
MRVKPKHYQSQNNVCRHNTDIQYFAFGGIFSKMNNQMKIAKLFFTLILEAILQRAKESIGVKVAEMQKRSRCTQESANTHAPRVLLCERHSSE